MKLFFKVLTLALIGFGLLLSVMLIKSKSFNLDEDRLAFLYGVCQWVFLISGGWCMATAALRALGNKPIRDTLLVGSGCVLAAIALSAPTWASGLALAITAAAAAAFGGRHTAESD
jgi:hypothetical protein